MQAEGLRRRAAHAGRGKGRIQKFVPLATGTAGRAISETSAVGSKYAETARTSVPQIDRDTPRHRGRVEAR